MLLDAHGGGKAKQLPRLHELKQLIESELDAADWIPLRQALAPHWVAPRLRMLAWPYSNPETEFPCWVIADLSTLRAELTLAYCATGRGAHGDPWGIVLSTDTSFRGDDSWFASLEDAFLASGTWTDPLPPDYEAR